MVLLNTKGPGKQRYFFCHPAETLIGRHDSIHISTPNDSRLSELHARVYFDPQLKRWMLEDLQSEHGTFLKIAEFDDPLMITAGDVFVAGCTTFRVFAQN